MRAETTLRLATAGSRVDGLRTTLTAAGSALLSLALLASLTVAAIGPDDGPYTSDLLNQPGLHPGVVIALVGLCVPVLVLLAQCSRIGAPARDRRLAAVRLAGASPAQVTRVVAVESGLGAAVGSLVGVAAHALLRAVLDTRVALPPADPADPALQPAPGTAAGALWLPTDVALPWWVVLAVAVAVPLAVVAATAWALRRVAFTPFGVVRRTRTRPPRLLPLVLLGVGLGVLSATPALDRAAGGLTLGPLTAVVLLGVLTATAGLLAGQGALAYELGRWLAGRTSSPALLLAARRMAADPFAATRATAVLSVAVLIAAGARHLREVTLAGVPLDEDFFVGAYRLVDLVLLVAAVLAALGLLAAAAEGVVARRRTWAAVVAAGTPRAVVGRAVLAETLLPLVPSLLAATVAGTTGAAGLYGRTAEAFDPVANAPYSVTVGFAWVPLALTCALAFAVTALAVSLSLLFLRSATDVTEIRAAA